MDYEEIKRRSMTLNYSTEGAISFSALALLDMTGLSRQGWTFEWNNRKRALGLCDYNKRTVFLSKYLVKAIKPHLRKDKVRQNLMHEIAHALVPGDQHGHRWRRVAIALGSDGERCGSINIIDTTKLEFKWRVTCMGENCGVQGHYNRMTTKRHNAYAEGHMRCRKCGSTQFKVKQLR